MFRPYFLFVPVLVLLAACTQSETTTERTVTPEGDTLVSITTRSTSVMALDTGKVENVGERLEETGREVKEDIKEGAGEVKEEWKETRSRVRNRVKNTDTLVVD